MSSVDIVTKLSNLLPTGTFLTFQVIAPLATNNGVCGLTERILTSLTLGILAMGCLLTTFTDSFTASNGKIYNGFITRYGLWVPGYEKTETTKNEDLDDEEPKCGSRFINKAIYKPQLNDYLNAVLSVTAFLTLTLFTEPVASCYYAHIPESLLKTLPVLMATVVGFFCSFSPKVRHGLGFALPKTMSTAIINEMAYSKEPTTEQA